MPGEETTTPLLTLFTTPKPFIGHVGMIQRNALATWARLGPDVRVIVFGEEEGTAGVAAELGLTHVPMIGRNRYGTPLLNSLVEQAQMHGQTPYLCYINADIILMSDFMEAVRRVSRDKKRFLMVGKRWDYDLTQPLDFTGDWQPPLRESVRAIGRPQRPTAVDYFVFARDMWGRLPAFAIGRTAWDNWLIYRARMLKVPVIDAGEVVTAVHQNHDYNHTGRGPGGKGYNWVWRGPEAKQNLAMAGGQRCLFTIWDSTHLLTPAGLERRPTDRGLGGGIWSYRRSAAHGI
ncbi:MAG: hypothetical protein K8S99_18515 [Planctomycetes bacterium]|nr:hypothetical protein [Planctomycetota bacterium]